MQDKFYCRFQHFSTSWLHELQKYVNRDGERTVNLPMPAVQGHKNQNDHSYSFQCNDELYPQKVSCLLHFVEGWFLSSSVIIDSDVGITSSEMHSYLQIKLKLRYPLDFLTTVRAMKQVSPFFFVLMHDHKDADVFAWCIPMVSHYSTEQLVAVTCQKMQWYTEKAGKRKSASQ